MNLSYLLLDIFISIPSENIECIVKEMLCIHGVFEKLYDVL